MKKYIVTIALMLATLAAFGQNQKSNKMEEKKEMKDTVIVDGKLVEVGYRVIADGVEDGFTKIEDGVIKGSKVIENGAVSGFNSVNDWFISKLFQRKGETLEQTKARLEAGRTKGTDIAEAAQERSKEISKSARSGSSDIVD